MRDPRKVIHRPLVTEKATRLEEDQNKYVFKVERDANKVEIKRAIQDIFGVTVTKVRTMNMHGKPKRLGFRSQGRRPDWKKAVVTLEEGETIEFAEEV